LSYTYQPAKQVGAEMPNQGDSVQGRKMGNGIQGVVSKIKSGQMPTVVIINVRNTIIIKIFTIFVALSINGITKVCEATCNAWNTCACSIR
jgi:hypothetical protein